MQPKRKASQFEDLHRAYLSLRCPKRGAVAALDARSIANNQADGFGLGPRVIERDALMGFGDVLKVYSQCSNLEVLPQSAHLDSSKKGLRMLQLIVLS